MSTHDDPSTDGYRELDKKVGEAEYEYLALLAETDKALDTAVDKGKENAKAVGTELKRKAAARPRKHDSDGL